VDPVEVARIRASLRASVSGLLEPITRESGRFTDTERKEAQKVLRGITPESDIKNVIGAFKAGRRLVMSSLIRNSNSLREAAGIKIKDLGTPDGKQKFGEALLRSGLTKDQATEVLALSLTRLGF